MRHLYREIECYDGRGRNEIRRDENKFSTCIHDSQSVGNEYLSLIDPDKPKLDSICGMLHGTGYFY